MIHEIYRHLTTYGTRMAPDMKLPLPALWCPSITSNIYEIPSSKSAYTYITNINRIYLQADRHGYPPLQVCSLSLPWRPGTIHAVCVSNQILGSIHLQASSFSIVKWTTTGTKAIFPMFLITVQRLRVYYRQFNERARNIPNQYNHKHPYSSSTMPQDSSVLTFWTGSHGSQIGNKMELQTQCFLVENGYPYIRQKLSSYTQELLLVENLSSPEYGEVSVRPPKKSTAQIFYPFVITFPSHFHSQRETWFEWTFNRMTQRIQTPVVSFHPCDTPAKPSAKAVSVTTELPIHTIFW